MIEYKSLRIIQRIEYQEIHCQLIPVPGETPELFSCRIAEVVQHYNAKIVYATFFGKLIEVENLIRIITTMIPRHNFPSSRIEGDNCSDLFINGVYILALSGIDIKRLVYEERVIGSLFQTGKAEFCYLAGLCPNPDKLSSQQTSEVLNIAENILNQQGFNFQNVIRTWYYLDDILGWYKDFNLVRTSFFIEHEIFKNLVPASTGIGGKNPSGSEVCLDLIALKPKSNEFSISQVSSPLQCPAENYGSSFSRAVTYSDNEYVNLTVSGTASINPEGETMHANDILKQIDLTFKVVTAILESQNFRLTDIIRFYAYCSDKSFSKVFYDYIETNIPLRFAFICSENKICRDGLLFEIELDAIKRIPGK
jgi:enamine deaminase RidA (YjgF/YER057c/UK114 family)